MTNTGHEARTQAVLENLKRRHTKEVQHLPDTIRQAMLEMVERIAALETLVAEQAQAISTLNLELISTKATLSEFRANVNAIGHDLAGKAA